MVKHTRRNRKTGGGWSMGPPLSEQTYYVPQYKSFDDCYAQARPGSIQSNPNPNLAQTRMAGGSRRTRKMCGGCGCGIKRQLRSGYRIGGGCGCAMRQKGGKKQSSKAKKSYKKKRGGSRTRGRQGSCGYYGAKGGRYTIDTSQSIGGDGPNAAPVYSRFPCEGIRQMPLNPTIPTMLSDSVNPDVNVSGLRPAFIQNGGNAPINQAFAPPSSLAYSAPRAGFSFMPNISQGANLEPGQIPYNIVLPQQTTGAGSCGQAIAAINKMT